MDTKYPGKTLCVYDNVFTHYDRNKFLRFIKKSAFNINGGDSLESIYQNQIFSSYSVDDVKNMGFPSTEGFQKIEKIHGLVDKPVFQARVNLSHSNEANMVHTDTKGLTILYYANLEWKIEWGGHTLFLDENLNEAKYTCLYKPGRVVVFDGTIPHMIMTPSPICPVQRFSFVIQYQPSYDSD